MCDAVLQKRSNLAEVQLISLVRLPQYEGTTVTPAGTTKATFSLNDLAPTARTVAKLTLIDQRHVARVDNLARILDDRLQELLRSDLARFDSFQLRFPLPSEFR